MKNSVLVKFLSLIASCHLHLMKDYNLTARKNRYGESFLAKSDGLKRYKLTVSGTTIPFIIYNIRF